MVAWVDAVAPGVAEPSYGDFIGRLRWMSSADREISSYVVWSRDSLGIDNDAKTEHAQLDSRSLYLWLRGEQHWDDGSQLTVWLGNTQLTSTRFGLSTDPLISRGSLADSRDANIWHLSHEGGILENPAAAPPADLFMLTSTPENAPDVPEMVAIEFDRGTPLPSTASTSAPSRC